jgi:hypothetical protein
MEECEAVYETLVTQGLTSTRVRVDFSKKASLPEEGQLALG